MGCEGAGCGTGRAVQSARAATERAANLARTQLRLEPRHGGVVPPRRLGRADEAPEVLDEGRRVGVLARLADRLEQRGQLSLACMHAYAFGTARAHEQCRARMQKGVPRRAKRGTP